MTTTIQPLTNRIAVRPKKPFDPQIPNFVIPESAQGEEPTEGEIVALGERRTPKGRPIEWDIQIGQQIAYRLYAGAPVHGTGIVIIKADDVLGILKPA